MLRGVTGLSVVVRLMRGAAYPFAVVHCFVYNRLVRAVNAWHAWRNPGPDRTWARHLDVVRRRQQRRRQSRQRLAACRRPRHEAASACCVRPFLFRPGRAFGRHVAACIHQVQREQSRLSGASLELLCAYALPMQLGGAVCIASPVLPTDTVKAAQERSIDAVSEHLRLAVEADSKAASHSPTPPVSHTTRPHTKSTPPTRAPPHAPLHHEHTCAQPHLEHTGPATRAPPTRVPPRQPCAYIYLRPIPQPFAHPHTTSTCPRYARSHARTHPHHDHTACMRRHT